MIIITRHAEERIKERTNLSLEDVQTIFNEGLHVELGQTKDAGRAFCYLFFSKVDNSHFVAVVSSDKTYLMTVLDPRKHHVPIYPNKKQHKLAREKFQKWIFKQRVTIPVAENPASAKLFVYVNNKKEFTYELGDVFLSQYKSKDDLFTQQLDLFKQINRIVAPWLLSNALEDQQVKYEFWVRVLYEKHYTCRIKVRHNKLTEYLQSDSTV